MLNSNNEMLLKQVNKNQTLLIQKLQDDISLLNEELNDSNKLLDTLKSEHHLQLQQQQSIIEDLRTECRSYQQQNMELQSKFTQSVLQNQLLQTKYDKKNKQYKDQIIELKQQLKLIHHKNQDYQTEILDLRKSLDIKKLELSKLNDNSNLLNQQNKQLKANLDLQQVDYENKIEQFQNLIQDKDEEITLIINENNILNINNQELMQKNINFTQTFQSQIETLQKDNQNYQTQLSELNTLIKQQHSDSSISNNDQQNTLKDNQKNQIDILEQQLSKLTNELKESELKYVQIKQVQESTISKLNHDFRLLEQKNEDLILHNNKLINEIKQNELNQQKESTIICQKISEFEISLLESQHQIEDLKQEKQKQELVVEMLNHQLQLSKQIQFKLEEDIIKYQNFLISHDKQLEAVTSNESSDSSDSSEELITEKPQQLNFDTLCTKLTEKIRLIQLRLEIYEKQIKQYKQEQHSKTVEIQKLFSENSESNLKLQKLSQIQTKLEYQLENQQVSIKQKDLTIQNLTLQITNQQQQIHENSNQFKQLQLDNQQYQQKIISLDIELSNLQNQILIDHTIKNDLQKNLQSIQEEQTQQIELRNSQQNSNSLSFDQILPNINYQILLYTEQTITQIKSLLLNKIDNLQNTLLRTINKYQKLQQKIQTNYHNIQNLYDLSQQTLLQKEDLLQKQSIQISDLLQEIHQKSILINQIQEQQEQQQYHQIKLDDLNQAVQKNTQLDLVVQDLNNQIQSKLNIIKELKQELDKQQINSTGTQFDQLKLQQQQKQIYELIQSNTNLNQSNLDVQLRLREAEDLNQNLQDKIKQLDKQSVSQKETINQLQQQNQIEVKQNISLLQQIDPLQQQIDQLTRENRKLQQLNNDFEKAYGQLPSYGSPKKVQNVDQNQIMRLEEEIQRISYKFQQEMQEKNIELNNIKKQYECQLEENRDINQDEIQKLEQNCITLNNQLKQQQLLNYEVQNKNSQIEKENHQLSEEINKLMLQLNIQSSQNQKILKQQEIDQELKQKQDQNLQLNNELQQQLNEQYDLVKDKQKLIVTLEQKIKQLDQVNKIQIETITQLNLDINNMNQQIDEQNIKIKFLTQQFDQKENQYKKDIEQLKIENQQNKNNQDNKIKQKIEELNRSHEIQLQDYQQIKSLNQNLQQRYSSIINENQSLLEQVREQKLALTNQNQQYILLESQFKQMQQNLSEQYERQIQKLMDQINKAEGMNIKYQNEVLEMDNLIKKQNQEKDKCINNDMIEQLQSKIKLNEEQIERLLMTNRALMEENTNLQDQIKDDLNSSYCSNSSQK